MRSSGSSSRRRGARILRATRRPKREAAREVETAAARTGRPLAVRVRARPARGRGRRLRAVPRGGRSDLPASGPAIVVANHPSDVDPILLGVSFPRTLHFMADVVQFRRGFVGPVIRRLAAFPIDKGSPDRRSLRDGPRSAAPRRGRRALPRGRPLPAGRARGLRAGGRLSRGAQRRAGDPRLHRAARSGSGTGGACAGRASRCARERRSASTAPLGLGGAPGPGAGATPERGHGRRGREAYVRFAEQTRVAAAPRRGRPLTWDGSVRVGSTPGRSAMLIPETPTAGARRRAATRGNENVEP